jgi:isocitrate dehydrogenase (NAD+)
LLYNLHSHIFSVLCVGLIGGLGLVPGANIDDSAAGFEAVHGSGPNIAGKGIANSTAPLQFAILMPRPHRRTRRCR